MTRHWRPWPPGRTSSFTKWSEQALSQRSQFWQNYHRSNHTTSYELAGLASRASRNCWCCTTCWSLAWRTAWCWKRFNHATTVKWCWPATWMSRLGLRRDCLVTRQGITSARNVIDITVVIRFYQVMPQQSAENKGEKELRFMSPLTFLGTNTFALPSAACMPGFPAAAAKLNRRQSNQKTGPSPKW